MKPRRIISRDVYLQALGLFSLAKYHYDICLRCETGLAKLLGLEDRRQFNGMQDAIYTDGHTFDDGLRLEGIAVAPEDTASPADLRRALTAASHALKSYAHDNGSPVLAEQISAEIDALLAKPDAVLQAEAADG